MCPGLDSVLGRGLVVAPTPPGANTPEVGMVSAVSELMLYKSTRETDPTGPSLETEGAMAV